MPQRLTITEVTTAYLTWQRIVPRELRFGQYFLNTYFPDTPAPEIYYLSDTAEAFAKIITDIRFCERSE